MRGDRGSDADDPCLGAALYARALVLDRLQRFDAAAESYARACALRPEDAEYHHARGANARRRNRHPRAEQCFSEALRLDPTHRAARAAPASADGGARSRDDDERKNTPKSKIR